MQNTIESKMVGDFGADFKVTPNTPLPPSPQKTKLLELVAIVMYPFIPPTTHPWF